MKLMGHKTKFHDGVWDKLFFYTLSKPVYIEAGVNDFIDFQVEFVEDIYEEFNQVMEILWEQY